MAKFMVFDAIAEHEIGRCQHRAGDGENGFLRAAPTLDAEALAAQIAVLLARGGPGRIDQCGFDAWLRLPGPRRPSTARCFVEPGAEARPRKQKTGRRETAHVGTDFSDEVARRRLAEAWHGGQEADSGAKGTERVSNA